MRIVGSTCPEEGACRYEDTSGSTMQLLSVSGMNMVRPSFPGRCGCASPWVTAATAWHDAAVAAVAADPLTAQLRFTNCDCRAAAVDVAQHTVTDVALVRRYLPSTAAHHTRPAGLAGRRSSTSAAAAAAAVAGCGAGARARESPRASAPSHRWRSGALSPEILLPTYHAVRPVPSALCPLPLYPAPPINVCLVASLSFLSGRR